MIAVRPARPDDAPGIGAVHVAAWRSAYPGILPGDYLARLSPRRHAALYEAAIRHGAGVHVATAADAGGGPPRVVGFVTVGAARTPGLGEGEIETLYVLDDWRERGLGRGLIRAGADTLAAAGCRSAFVWVLRDNPSRWFYEHLSGRMAAESTVQVAGHAVPQLAYVWPRIDTLRQAASSDGDLA
jgi:hypothetical protein